MIVIPLRIFRRYKAGVRGISISWREIIIAVLAILGIAIMATVLW